MHFVLATAQIKGYKKVRPQGDPIPTASRPAAAEKPRLGVSIPAVGVLLPELLGCPSSLFCSGGCSPPARLKAPIPMGTRPRWLKDVFYRMSKPSWVGPLTATR
jgi:hypothetical protein